MDGIDIAAVTAWFERNVDGAHAPFDFELLTGGRSNLTYVVTGADGTRFVLRRPPLGKVLATAHDVLREHHIIRAVGTTSVPVPPALGPCDDTSVNGAPFYVMGWVDGVVLDRPSKAEQLELDARARAAHDLVDVLADLHAVDVDAVGLGDLGKRDGYVERQLRRWTAQWESSKTRELAAIDETARLLAADVPPQRGVSIAHGDYRLGNCLTDAATGRINAVLDWELCAIGDPLADLGYVGVFWSDGHPLDRLNDPTEAGGFPSYDDIVARYASRSGRDISELPYYVALGCWRLAIIGEGVYARYKAGAMGEQPRVQVDRMRSGIDALAERALRALREGTITSR